MTLLRESQTLSGTAEIAKEAGVVGIASLLAGPVRASETKQPKVEKYTLTGTLKGAVCKFTMTVREQGQHFFGTILGGSGARSGFIIFAADGRRGTYAELRDDKLDTRIEIVKTER